MKTKTRGFLIHTLALTGCFFYGLSQSIAQEPSFAVSESFAPTALSWSVDTPFQSATLTVRRPGPPPSETTLALGSNLFLDLSDATVWTNGSYSYELQVFGNATPGQGLNDGRETSATKAEGLRAAAMPSRTVIARKVGNFTIAEGVVPMDDEDGPRPRDQVINDDLIVDGSACIGFDCVNGESFGFDTLRLKENNIRINFHDTSSSASFPSTDWRISINDTSNGGDNHFSIDDASVARTPFRIRAGAPNWSIFVSQTGRVGFGTSSPNLELHVLDGDTPALRLEQAGGGFGAQTWDIAGNETNFFVRDLTNGSRLPFRIRPGAPTSSIDVAATGNIGAGTASPAASLHVRRTDGTAKVMVQDVSTTPATRNMLELENMGPVQMMMRNTSTNQRWKMGLDQVEGNADSFVISRAGTGGPELAILTSGEVRIGAGASTGLRVAPNGNVQIGGTLVQGSSRAIKENFARLNPHSVLDRVGKLPVAVWNYKTDDASVRHIGPMAEDFREAFELGTDPQHLAPSDVAGVALVAIQGLRETVNEKDRQLAELSDRISQLECLVARLTDDAQKRETSSDGKATGESHE